MGFVFFFFCILDIKALYVLFFYSFKDLRELAGTESHSPAQAR